MKRHLRVWLAAGLALASACLTLLLYFSLRPATVPVVVVTESVQPFSALQPSQLMVVQVDAATAERLFPGAYADPKALAGMVTVRWLRKNEVLFRNDTTISPRTQIPEAVKSKGVPLSYMIPANHKAFVLNASLPSAAPGDYVVLYRPGDSQPVLERPVEVISNSGSGLLVLLMDQDVARLMAAPSQLVAALAQAPHLGEAIP